MNFDLNLIDDFAICAWKAYIDLLIKKNDLSRIVKFAIDDNGCVNNTVIFHIEQNHYETFKRIEKFLILE